MLEVLRRKDNSPRDNTSNRTMYPRSRTATQPKAIPNHPQCTSTAVRLSHEAPFQTDHPITATEPNTAAVTAIHTRWAVSHRPADSLLEDLEWLTRSKVQAFGPLPQAHAYTCDPSLQLVHMEMPDRS